MGVSRKNKTPIIEKTSNKIEPDRSTFGRLIQSKFYGPSKHYDHWKYNKTILTIEICVGSLTIILFGTFLFIETGMKNILGEIITIVSGFTLPFVYWISYNRDKTSMDMDCLIKRGELDWDLYENGLLVRNYSDESPNHISEYFEYFSIYPFIYFNVGDNDIHEIWNHVKMAAKKARELDGGVYDKTYFDSWEDGRTEYIKSTIWFHDGKDGQEDFEMDRDWLRDPKIFENALRHKVPGVK